MTVEQVLKVMGHIDPALIEGVSQKRRRISGAVRAVLIAACLCVVLAGTVIAVEILSGVFLSGATEAEGQDGIELLLEGITAIPKEEINEAFWISVAECEGESLEKGVRLPMEYQNWQTASNHIGIPLKTSDVLAEAEVQSCYVYTYGEFAISVHDEYVVNGNSVRVCAYLNVENVSGSKMENFDVVWEDGVILATENYPMADGTNGVIIVTECTRNGQSLFYYTGCFVSEGILYTVDLTGGDGYSGERMVLLKEILAAVG